MEIITTAKIEIRARYDICDRVTYGKVYSKEDNVHVADIREVGRGSIELKMLPGFEDREEYVKADFEQKLKPELVDYANFWHAREDRPH